MLYEQKLSGPVVNWPQRPKDAVQVPAEPQIRQWLENYKCTCRVGHNCYEIVNEKGDALELPFGVAIGGWLIAIKQVASV